ncbi:MAG TPA: ABC transporter substrate-binding protein [Stellaceae bacterium]|nr:ABC transporter substrate-binding protein [Stellaceae bacterium]
MARGGGIRCLFRAFLALVWPALLFAAPAAAQSADHVRLQLMWLNQAQFAGIYLARDKGLYADEDLTVETIEGGPAIAPVDVMAKGGADVAIAWLSSALDARRRGLDVVNIAQILRRPGMTVLCRRDAGIRSILDIAGKSVGVWNVGDEITVRDWLKGFSIPLDRVSPVQQAANGADLLSGRVACATAMMYNEYWSIVEGGLPPDKLIDGRLGDGGFGFLEDGLYVPRAALTDPARRAVLVRFLRATLAGWRLAKQNPEDAFAATMKAAPNADPVHQRRMLETILDLVGDIDRVGLLDEAAYRHSVETIASQSADGGAVRTAGANGSTELVWNDATATPK